MRGLVFATMLGAGVALVGCSNAPAPETTTSPARLLVRPEPALGVAEARKVAKDHEEIVLTGRIGGEEKPFVEGVAAFTIVDRSLDPCPAAEGCPTPWDYCCDTDKLPERKALVQVVDERGKLIAADARPLLGVKELSTVTVRGIAARDDAGNLTVLAKGVYVEAD